MQTFFDNFAKLARKLIVPGVLAYLSVQAQAQSDVTIDIDARQSGIRIAIPTFQNEAAIGNSISEVVRADLQRAGTFAVVVDQPEWAVRATVTAVANGRFNIRVWLTNFKTGKTIPFDAPQTKPEQYRATGHSIADFILGRVTGQGGFYSGRIAYISKTGNQYAVYLSDADGERAKAALKIKHPVISPMFSPDGTQLAYVSFEKKKPIIYVHTLATGKRQILANYKGSNSAPSWSPDGRKLAVVLTKDGFSQIYTINADGSGATRLMNTPAIDTEPVYSIDGRYIYFTSDRSGAPQIYRIPVSGGAAERVSFQGKQNVSPAVSPDGRRLTYVSDGRIAVQSLANGAVSYLTAGNSPRFPANNSEVIMFTSGTTLAIVSVNSGQVQRVPAQGAIRQPVWGPAPR